MNPTVCIDIEKTEAEELAEKEYLRRVRAERRKPDYKNEDRHQMYV